MLSSPCSYVVVTRPLMSRNGVALVTPFLTTKIFPPFSTTNMRESPGGWVMNTGSVNPLATSCRLIVAGGGDGGGGVVGLFLSSEQPSPAASATSSSGLAQRIHLTRILSGGQPRSRASHCA